MKLNPQFCEHNQRCRYTHGFFCEDCGEFFGKDSPTYRSGEYLSTLWMVCHNINASALQAKKPEVPEALAMRDKIGIGIRHKNYEEIIAEAEALIAAHGTNTESATVLLR
jgi:hypothetical protein